MKKFFEIYYPIVLAFLSFLLSVTLWFTGNQLEGIFVGIWVPSILSLSQFYLIQYSSSQQYHLEYLEEQLLYSKCSSSLDISLKSNLSYFISYGHFQLFSLVKTQSLVLFSKLQNSLEKILFEVKEREEIMNSPTLIIPEKMENFN